MDFCNKVTLFFQSCFPAKTDVVEMIPVQTSELEISVHNDCPYSDGYSCSDECECRFDEINLSEKLGEIIQILEEVNDEEEEDDSGKFSLI